MSTKVLRCPWCHTTNLANKLETRGDRCRECGNRVAWGLAYLRKQARERRRAKTKKARAELKRRERSTPAYREMLRVRRLGRQYRSAERRVEQAWQRVALTANERDFAGVVASTRALVRAERAKQRARRAMTSALPATRETTDARAIILPDKEDA